MKSELIVSVGPYENRIAMLEDNKLVELFIHQDIKREIVGNIYKGIVRDNVPGMGAAFIDIGLSRTALLHFRDAVPDFLDDGESEDEEIIKIKGLDKRCELLEVGNEIMVQVEKAPFGKKGARLTGQISIPGMYMVYVPNKSYVAVSRNITTYKERKRLKRAIAKIKDNNVGIIVRTNAKNRTEKDFKSEYANLEKIWQGIQEKFKDSPAPHCIYDDNNLPSLIIKDLIHKSIDQVIIDSKSERTRVIKRLKRMDSQMIKKIKLYQGESEIFDSFGIEKEISKILRPRIYLESGGYIVIQQTEAMVSIDVNTGSFVGEGNLEKTVTTTNIDAAIEIARQIRLQNLSGMIIIDFIDMQKPENRKLLIKTFRNEMSKDYIPYKIFSSSPLNMVEMTRKRAASNIQSSFFATCPCCIGTGRVISRSTVINTIFRWLSRAAKFHQEDNLEIHIHPWINDYIKEKQPMLENDYPFSWKFVANPELSHNQYKIISLKSKRDITNLYKT